MRVYLVACGSRAVVDVPSFAAMGNIITVRGICETRSFVKSGVDLDDDAQNDVLIPVFTETKEYGLAGDRVSFKEWP